MSRSFFFNKVDWWLLLNKENLTRCSSCLVLTQRATVMSTMITYIPLYLGLTFSILNLRYCCSILRRVKSHISVTQNCQNHISIRPEDFCKIYVLENFTKFTENSCVIVSFSIKLPVLGLQPLLKKRLWHRCFPVNFAKFLRAPFFIEHLWWLLLESNETLFIFIWRIFQVAETAVRRCSSKKVVLKIL